MAGVAVTDAVRWLLAHPDFYKSFTVEVRLGGPVDVVDEVARAARRYFTSQGWVEGDDTPVGLPEVRRTPVGVQVYMDWVDDAAAAEGLLAALADDLTRAGYAGEITVELAEEVPALVSAASADLKPAASSGGRRARRSVLLARDVQDKLRNPLVWESLALQVRLTGAPDVSDRVRASAKAFFDSRGWVPGRSAPIAFPVVERTAAGVQMTMAWVNQYIECEHMLRALVEDLNRDGHAGVVSVARKDSFRLRLPESFPAIAAGWALNWNPPVFRPGEYPPAGWHGDGEQPGWRSMWRCNG